MPGLVALIRLYLEKEALALLRPFRMGIKKVFLGAVFLLVGLPFIVVGLIALLVSLFFHLSQYSNLTMPALVSGLIGIIIGTLVLIIGLITVRR